MRVFTSRSDWAWGEREVVEKKNDTCKFFTLTQPKTLFHEDYYSVRRTIAIENGPIDVDSEMDFYVYEFSYMGIGCVLHTVIVDEITAKELISTCLTEFLHGNATSYIKNFFEERL